MDDVDLYNVETKEIQNSVFSRQWVSSSIRNDLIKIDTEEDLVKANMDLVNGEIKGYRLSSCVKSFDEAMHMMRDIKVGKSKFLTPPMDYADGCGYMALEVFD